MRPTSPLRTLCRAALLAGALLGTCTLARPVTAGPAETATITIDLAHPTHTLPTSFFGVGFGGYYHEDAQRGDYLALVKALSPELVRLHMYSRSPGTVAAPSAEMADHLRMAEALVPIGVKILMQLGAAPASSSRPPTEIANVDGGDRGPSSHAAWVTELVRRFGASLHSVESYNEPATNVGAWFSSDRACADWATVHQRQYYDAVKTAAPSVPHYGAVLATTSNHYAASEMQRFLYGQVPGWPWPDDNLKHLDVVSFHGYQSADAVSGLPTLDFQSEINRAFYPHYDANRGGYFAGVDAFRKLLDAKGATSVHLAMTEFGTFGTEGKRARGALMDAVLTTIAANHQAQWQLDQLSFHAVNRNLILADGSDAPGGGGDSIILFGPDRSFHTSVRYQVMKGILGPFLHGYKRQLSPTVVSVPTPKTAADDAVDAVQSAAGWNAEGTRVAVLVLNVDLTASHTVKIDFGRAATGPITGRFMPASQPFDAALPTIAPIHADSSFSATLGAGEVYLFEIPFDVVPLHDAGPADARDADALVAEPSIDAGDRDAGANDATPGAIAIGAGCTFGVDSNRSTTIAIGASLALALSLGVRWRRARGSARR